MCRCSLVSIYVVESYSFPFLEASLSILGGVILSYPACCCYYLTISSRIWIRFRILLSLWGLYWYRWKLDARFWPALPVLLSAILCVYFFPSGLSSGSSRAPFIYFVQSCSFHLFIFGCAGFLRFELVVAGGEDVGELASSCYVSLCISTATMVFGLVVLCSFCRLGLDLLSTFVGVGGVFPCFREVSSSDFHRIVYT